MVLVIAFIVLLIITALVTVIGHALWLMCEAIVRALSDTTPRKFAPGVLTWQCDGCKSQVLASWMYCGVCGIPKVAEERTTMLRELVITLRQLARLRRQHKIEEETYDVLKQLLDRECYRLKTPVDEPAAQPERESVANSVTEPVKSEVVVAPTPVTQSTTNELKEEKTSFTPPAEREPVVTPKIVAASRPRRRSFTEVLNSFMEESNIRWGEIIGGLLIIGCSTALVVSLWAQISQIPVLKFLIFTTVTAVLFGIGIYTEHRWKLPTTSRGILTIATLLVPLNFLAIAAVSSSETTGGLVLMSELLAPGIFLCLVYFAGRVITPGCAQILAGGVLGSSISQLLVRHFASSETDPWVLVLLGAFPVLCYVVSVCLALRHVLSDGKIDSPETSTIFSILGTMSFAALLPFGLLLYKAGPLSMSMMYLAPLVTLAGVPLLATGTVLWRRIQDEGLAAARTTGTALGILGLAIALTGMILAWPNPASIVPAALLNFLILTILAEFLEVPFAHLVAANCFALGYLVLFQVFAGHVAWQNLRVTSLLAACLDLSSGQALIGAFAIFLIASEWLARKQRHSQSDWYLTAASEIAIISLLTVTAFGPIRGSDLTSAWISYAIYSLGGFLIAWRYRLTAYAFFGSALLLFTLVSRFAWNDGYSFPWQTALLIHATLCGIAAIASSRLTQFEGLSRSLNYSSLITLFLAVISMFQTNPWQVTSMQAERVFWVAGLLFMSLWLNRHRAIFFCHQLALTAAIILVIKATLQQYEWYTYVPHAFLHPSALQIQGTVLALFSLFWLGAGWLLKRQANERGGVFASFWKLFDTRYSVDRVIPWFLIGGLLLLSIYSALSGVVQEFESQDFHLAEWNIAGFPHQEAYALGSWILFGLLSITMIVSLWQRRRIRYLMGLIITASSAIPLLAARFETEVASATAWRFFAVAFLVFSSIVVWLREGIALKLKAFGWAGFEKPANVERHSRSLVIALTCLPLLFFTVYPSLNGLGPESVQAPVGSIFSFFSINVSYTLPLVLVGLVFAGYAVRERLPWFNFYSALVFNLSATIAYLWTAVRLDIPLNLVQLNAIAISVHGLLWLMLRGSWLRTLESNSKTIDSILNIETGLAAGLNLALLVPSTLRLVVAGPGAEIQAGRLADWLAFALAVALVIAVKVSARKRLSAGLLTTILLSVTSLISFTFAGGEEIAIELKLLTNGAMLVAWLLFVASNVSESLKERAAFLRLEDGFGEKATNLSAIIGGASVLLSVRLLLLIHDTSYWWGIVPLILLSGLALSLQFQTLRRGYLYAAGILLNLAVTVWWSYQVDDYAPLRILVSVNLIAACTIGVIGLLLELRTRRVSKKSGDFSATFHSLVLGLGVVLLILSALNRIKLGFTSSLDLELTWSAWASAVVLALTILWDKRARLATAALYSLGLIGGAFVLAGLDFNSIEQAVWSALIFLSFYTTSVALLWRKPGLLAPILKGLRLSRGESLNRPWNWFPAATIVMVVAIAATSFWIDLTFVTRALRVTAALAVIAQALTCGLLAKGPSRMSWQRLSFAAFIAGAVLFGWSWLSPFWNATWLNRNVILMVESLGVVALFGLLLDRLRKFSGDWADSIQVCMPVLLGVGVLSLLFCLSTEVSYELRFGAVIIHPAVLAAIGVTLIAAVITPVIFALYPEYDPMELTERGRMKYVYASEVLLGLLFLHIRLTMPWLFNGFFERYWPVVVIAIAYFGVVASESLRQKELLVLATPIERTGAFLPLLPVVGFWLATSEVDYSLLLFLVGGLYGLLSVLRRSFVFGALAAAAGNAGLWYLLQRTDDYQFFQHPQMFLIPAALSVLVAAYLNEDKLTEEQLAGLRYLSLVTVYASSTADIFINGVINTPWLPLILGGLSLAGVFSGIMFKIRGLLLLGSTFLLLSIVTMIWYASVNLGWTWLWYVAGIATGATIIFMFALFEKKRTDVLRLVEGLKEWEV